MARPELGEKHICAECKIKYYDLSRSPIACPKCGAELEESGVAAIIADEAEKEVNLKTAAATATDSSKHQHQSTDSEKQEFEEEEFAPPVDSVEEGPEFISLEDAAADENEAAGELENEDNIPEDLPDVDIEEDANQPRDEETFLEEDQDASSNISDIVGVQNEEKEDL